MAQYDGYNGVKKVIALSAEQIARENELRGEREETDKAAKDARMAYVKFFDDLVDKDFDWYLDDTRQFLLLRKRGMVGG